MRGIREGEERQCRRGENEGRMRGIREEEDRQCRRGENEGGMRMGKR